MTAHSDDAEALAGDICANVFYPRMADFILRAIMHCTLDAQPLSDEQCEQLFRASFEAGDGVMQDVARAIDERTVVAFRRSLEEAPDA